jgi:hypothetical protein
MPRLVDPISVYANGGQTLAISAKRPGKIRIRYSQWFFWAALPLKRNLQTTKRIARKKL